MGAAHGEVIGDGDFKPTSLLLVAITAALSNADCERVRLYGKKKNNIFLPPQKGMDSACARLVFFLEDFFFDSSQPIVYKMAP